MGRVASLPVGDLVAVSGLLASVDVVPGFPVGEVSVRPEASAYLEVVFALRVWEGVGPGFEAWVVGVLPEGRSCVDLGLAAFLPVLGLAAAFGLPLLVPGFAVVRLPGFVADFLFPLHFPGANLHRRVAVAFSSFSYCCCRRPTFYTCDRAQ